MYDGSWSVVFCFFQAEDGIRDLVRSRGLGDVYKRQPLQQEILRSAWAPPGPSQARRVGQEGKEAPKGVSVSYTHLTLPTSDLV